jgi:hypothetical protein
MNSIMKFQEVQIFNFSVTFNTLGRPRHRWEDNINMDRKEMEIDGDNWIRLAQNRVRWWAFVGMVMNLRVP